ncbi:40S ribosomal protein s15a-1-like, partial [Trifolium pratense]
MAHARIDGGDDVTTTFLFSVATMVRVSVLNDALKSMYNAEKRGKRQVMIRPSSKVIIKFLIVMQKHGYIGEFEYVDDHRAGKIVVELNGRLNKCGVISPRFDVGVKEIEGWTARLLPSRQFGYIVLTTSAGIMDHEEARRKNVGGKVSTNGHSWLDSDNAIPEGVGSWALDPFGPGECVTLGRGLVNQL